ncbi:very short patch repair endonuclease [Roseomonas sp. KE0001]|uniref:very short patch repair endonuclease n=1 Tax=Roseomonas sp. KE0001 TaxID=2479201 RepID=UPI002102E475|nr:very short patch repair endonuclease [Roseomonas sp. KE0001]
MSPEKRSAVMARIRGKDTGPELAMAAALKPTRFQYESHVRDLPGRPDFVFRRHKVVVFVDGDFWHGWRFRNWRDKLSEKWEAKIEANRQRDLRNFRRLRAEGWRVLRIWEHEVKANAKACATRVVQAIRSGRKRPLDAPKRLASAAQPGRTAT